MAILGDGRKTVASTSAAERLSATSVAAQWVLVSAEEDNTGVVAVGSSTVESTLATRQGIPLDAGESTAVPCGDLHDVWLDVTVAGDGVTYVYGTGPLPAGGSGGAGGGGTIDGDVSVVNDPTVHLASDAVIGHNVTGIGDGRKVVTTAGTRVALAASTPAKYVIVTAETDNTGIVVVGAVTCVAALATRQGTPLVPGQSAGRPCDDLADIYLDSTVSTDGVTYEYFT